MTAKIRIVLQARYVSQRLPGKALLPVAGEPMVVLAGKRATRRGLDLVVATSTNAADHPVAQSASAGGLAVYRGPLENVYERFLGATRDLPDDALIVRITADNVFPDSELIQSLIARIETLGVPYLAPRWPEDGLPYGVTAEVFRAKALRQARPRSREEAEHVTTGLLHAYRNPGLKSEFNLSELRATVDTASDYSSVCQVFSGISDPVQIDWRDLCRRLAALPQPRIPSGFCNGEFQSQMTLGTAQFGMKYGVANTTGMPDQREVSRIVHTAIERGVTHIDTARGYAASEERIGIALRSGFRSRVRLITKLAPIVADSAASATAATEDSISESLKALETEHLDIVLLHRASNRELASGTVWERLLDFRRNGVIGRVGVSVQNGDEFDKAVADDDVELIQMPFNILDRRWDKHLPVRDGLSIHVRSVFLQGLLAGLEAERWPRVNDIKINELCGTLQSLARECGRQGIADLALAYARSQSWIDSFVIGVETEAQLKENIELFTKAPLDSGEASLVRGRIPAIPERLLDPSQWPLQ